mmetsp:Transcript_138288/g.275653  ORF Transcript_138288/g.275653 Transcript_138288/m.275653 type:complete len:342 (+) Transcript_138288:48-1073(+)
MTFALPGRMQRCCESVRRSNTSYAWVRYASGSHASPLQLPRATQQRLNRPCLKAFQQRHSVKLHIQRQRVSNVDGKGHGLQQLLFAIADFELEISKPDDDIDLPKAAALLALHSDAKVDAVNLVTTELSRLKAGFRAHAADTVPLAAPLPPTCRQHALAGALCDFLQAEGFQGCSLANYFQAENSMLPSVLENKCGNPNSLALLYREVGHAGGLHLKGVHFPRHTLLQFGGASHAGLLEPFSNRMLSRSEVENFLWSWKAPLSNVVFLQRMAANLQHVYQRNDNTKLAARLAPYMDLLDEHVSMHDCKMDTGGFGNSHPARDGLVMTRQEHRVAGQVFVGR